jgi:hypothetical protein
MESENHCQWSSCTTEADKHVVFGRRMFDPNAGIDPANAPEAREHRNLCQKHVEKLRSQYLFVIVYKQGECLCQKVVIREQ